VLIFFAISRYSDDVIYDVVPMHTSHLFLGHLWQFDRKVIHDGFRNRYIIVKDDKIITLVPLSLKQVYNDQLKLKRKCEVRENENSCEENYERRPSDLANSKSIIKPVESGDKTQGVKKISVSNDHCVEKLRKPPSFYARDGKIKYMF